jgi:hypothetical protein
MNDITCGLIAGLLFGILSVLIMIPIPFPSVDEKRRAMLGSLINRFAIGLIIPTLHIGVESWLRGLLVGLLLSLPDAIITKSYAPILGFGVIGGILVGWLCG